MDIDRNKIARAWLQAGDDLGIEVIAPFAIKLEDGYECEFIALIKGFGSPKGTVICSPEEWDDLGYAYLAEEYEYHSSGLYSVYEHYNRDRFINTLNDWGWAGSDGEKPAWHTSASSIQLPEGSGDNQDA